MTPSKENKPGKMVIAKKRLGEHEGEDNLNVKEKKAPAKKVLFIEIDDEITTIYDRLKRVKNKNVYLVVPKRAILFQSIVNLKILKRKAEDVGKNIFIITNDQNGIHLAGKIGMPVYDRVEGAEHPSLVSGKFHEDQQNITPLKASINTLDEASPMRRKDKKLAISDIVGRVKQRSPFSALAQRMQRRKTGEITKGAKYEGVKETKGFERGKLVLVAPNRHALVSLIVVSLLILVTITYIALPGATVALTPKSNVLETSANITLADLEANRAELDARAFHTIPTYEVTRKIEKVFTYQATGKDFHGENARGRVTLVNSATNEWPLVEKTRLQTDDGLVFRIETGVTVPAAKSDKEPGKLTVPVVADELDAYEQVIGDRGNIGPSRFFLPGLSGSNQEKVFAESSEAFTGGKTSVTKKIAAEDIEVARNKMIQELDSAAEAELMALVRERNESQKTNLELLKGSDVIVKSEPIVFIPSGLEGKQAEGFDVQGEVVVSGVAYSRDELLTILKSELRLKQNPQKTLYRIDENTLTYRILERDVPGKKIRITATLQGIEEFEISPDKENGSRLIKKIKDHILNMNIHEAELYIQNLPEIDKVLIESWPAWAPSLPGIPDNIKIEIRRSDTTEEKK